MTFFGFRTYQAPASNQFPFNTYPVYALETPWLTYEGTSTQDIVNYYANLLILQYVNKPKAYATIQAVVTPVVMNQLPNEVNNGFNITNAEGAQLDILGKYAGVTRSGNGKNGPITLNDQDFSKLIQMAIISNSSGSSLSTIQNLLQLYFANEIFVFDYENMQMGYAVDSNSVNSDLIQLFITEGLLPKPMGVQLASVVYSPVIKTFFGCRTYEAPAFNNSPLNSYSDYEVNRPFLNYEDVL